jgi:hypothetical protein
VCAGRLIDISPTARVASIAGNTARLSTSGESSIVESPREQANTDSVKATSRQYPVDRRHRPVFISHDGIAIETSLSRILRSAAPSVAEINPPIRADFGRISKAL